MDLLVGNPKDTYMKSDGRTIALQAWGIGLLEGSKRVHIPFGKLVSTYTLEVFMYGALEELHILVLLEGGARHEFSLNFRSWGGVEYIRTVQRCLEFASALFCKERFQEDTLADWSPTQA
jgi:hypothetical protein